MSPSRSILKRAIAAAGAIGCIATPAAAHGFGQRYELPLPLSLYLFGAGAAVALSFVIFGLFVRRASLSHVRPQIDLLATPVGPLLASPALIAALKAVTLVLFAVTIWAGFFGDQNPYRNIAPTLVWIIWWVGMVYVSAFLGHIWTLINPWSTLYDRIVWARRRFVGGGTVSSPWPCRPAIGVWPACILLLAFSWTELVYPSPAVPLHIAGLATAYSFLTLAGMVAFGRDVWLARGEVFTLVFGLFARFAPTEPAGGKLLLRPYGTGLLDQTSVSPSMVALVLLLLATVLYDGLLTTPQWSEFEAAISPFMPWSGANAVVAARTVGLVGFWLLFMAIYGAISIAMSLAAGRRIGPLPMAQSFAFTLVPIAIGYHVAHYLVFLLVQGQYIIPLLSDPFGYGWNLFDTASYRVDIGLVGARFSWYAAVGAIVIGHVAAVYFAHVKALQVIPQRRAALRSQIPLTALMVVYTFTGLSIISEPIVERRTPATPTSVAAEAVQIPPDAITYSAADAAFVPAGAGKIAAEKLTYRVLGSAFQDGTRTSIADLIYAYVFAYRWGVHRDGDEAHYDPYVDIATAPMRRSLAALKIAGTDSTSKSFRVGDVDFVREIFTIDIYTSAVPQDADHHAAVAAPWSTLPWHLIVLMEEAVGRGWAVFSQAEARHRGIPWLDLVRSEDLKQKLSALVMQFERSGYRPAALKSLVSEDEARKRWTALAAFYKAHGHFLVTNGPYRLKQWSDTSATVEAFRDLSYPLGVGSYDFYARPRRGFVTKVQQAGGRLSISGDVEVVQKFQRSYRLVRTPLASLGHEVRKRLAPECRYTIIDDNGRVVLSGTLQLGDNSPDFALDFGRQLPAGRYNLYALIAMAGNVMNADISQTAIDIRARQ